jgi:hypothetical protein
MSLISRPPNKGMKQTKPALRDGASQLIPSVRRTVWGAAELTTTAGSAARGSREAPGWPCGEATHHLLKNQVRRRAPRNCSGVRPSRVCHHAARRLRVGDVGGRRRAALPLAGPPQCGSTIIDDAA